MCVKCVPEFQQIIGFQVKDVLWVFLHNCILGILVCHCYLVFYRNLFSLMASLMT